MADGPISGFATLAGSAVDQSADSIPILDNSAVGAAKNKRMTFAEFFTSRIIDAASLTGITTSSGASVTTANAIGALAVDVTKGLNTKSVAANSTFTFSGAPATANTWFSLHVTNTDTAAHILTFPSAFSQVTQAARTTCPIAASGQLWLMFRYDGTNYKVFGDSAYFNKFDGTAAPAVTDDIDLGYGPGSLWYDATGNRTYICEANTDGAAVWTPLGSVTNAAALTSNSVMLGAGTDASKVASAMTTDGAGVLTLGTAGSVVGATAFKNATSGTVTVQPVTGALGTVTLSLPAKTATIATTSQTDAGFSFGPIATVADIDYVITCKAPHAGTLTDLAAKTDSGTCTVTWKINTTAVTTGVNSATSTISAVTPSAANVFAAGDILKVTVSSNSSALNLQLAARYTRTLG